MSTDQNPDLTQRRLNRRERKAKRLAMVKAIQRMRDDGFSTDEVAAALGVTARMAQVHAAKHLGITINTVRSRRLGGWVPADAASVVRRIAERTGKAPSHIVGRLLAIALENDGRMAIKMLGKEALPPKAPVVVSETPMKTKRELQREAREAREREAREAKDRAKAADAARQAMKERMR